MKIRIKFSKHGAIRYIGHLDIMRYFQKAIRRSELPVAYTQGYNPHQSLAFAQPLGVGIESEGEYFDLELTELKDKNKMIIALNKKMTDGIKIIDMVLLPEHSKNAMASVKAASYKVTFFSNHQPNFNWQTDLLDFLNSDIIAYTKKTKKNTIELNLKESIYEYKLMDDGIHLLLNASSGGNIKPKYIFEAFYKSLNIELHPFALFITRQETYGEIIENDVHNFVPLLKFGDNF
jgi:radical SAM-linked protein